MLSTGEIGISGYKGIIVVRRDGCTAGEESPINQRVPRFWERNGRVFFVVVISLRKLILPQGKLRYGILCGFVLVEVYYDSFGFDKGAVREIEY